MWPWLFITISILTSILAEECITPNGVRGQCTLLDNCDPVYDFITSSKRLTSFQSQYINLLSCFEDDYGRLFVCCASNDPFFEQNKLTSVTKATTLPPVDKVTNFIETRAQFGNTLPDPEEGACGSDLLTNRVIGGTNAELGQFPWMALLEYRKPITKVRAFSCGGSLINQRYVLTAAHCTVGLIIRIKGNLFNVRLGEHNLNTTKDCEVYEDNYEVCASPVVDVGVEYAIPHPDYNQIGVVPYNDIGLVRLERDIMTTDYVQPICFPDRNYQSPVNASLTVAGWGRIDNVTSRSAIKQKVNLPIVSFSRCQETFYPVEINSRTQICAGAESGKDSCNGDSGGPLMYFLNGFWIIEGVVSFGLNGCGQDGVSAIYTRVNAYTDWIVSSIS